MRTLTVSTLCRVSGPDHRPRWSQVPFIRVSGCWLARAGFAPGQKVKVVATGGILQIIAEGSAK
jgi:hypothetical protein